MVVSRSLLGEVMVHLDLIPSNELGSVRLFFGVRCYQETGKRACIIHGQALYMGVFLYKIFVLGIFNSGLSCLMTSALLSKSSLSERSLIR